MKIGIIGKGIIGSELIRKSKLLNWDIKFILDSKNVYKDQKKIDSSENYLNYCRDVDVVFLAIPSLCDGKIAFNYIYNIVNKGINVVTCEKAALSNYFLQLNPYLNKIGFSATVGGGTRIIKYIETMMCDNITSMHIIVNGTLNYIFEEMSKGSGIAEAIKNAKTLGYVEPGANNILDIVNEESYHDIPMKLSILHNFFKFGKIIKTNDIKAKKITKSELNQLTEEAYYRRYIISLRKYPMEEKNIIGGFEYKTDKWNISAGFKNISKKTPLLY